MTSFYTALCAHYDYIFPLTEGMGRFVETQLAGKTRVLEIGTAKGALMRRLAAAGHVGWGIDLDETMIAAARKSVTPGLDFRVLDMREVGRTFKAASFDAVVCVGNTLVHLPDAETIATVLTDIFGLLRPGGRLLLQIINYDRILDRGLDGLPSIDNAHIRFDRHYRLHGPTAPLDFETVLTVKSTGESFRQTVPLFPIRSEALQRILPRAGFGSVAAFDGFSNAPFDPRTSVQLVMTGDR